MSYKTDITRSVWDEMEGVAIDIKPSPEAPSEYVAICTHDTKSSLYFGEINFSIPKAMAFELGKALIAASED